MASPIIIKYWCVTLKLQKLVAFYKDIVIIFTPIITWDTILTVIIDEGSGQSVAIETIQATQNNYFNTSFVGLTL